MNVRAGMVALAACGAVALAAGPAGAGIVSVGLGGGVVVPVSDVDKAFDNGVNGHGFVKFNIPFLFTPRVDFVFQSLDMKDASIIAPDFTPGTYSGGSQEIASALAHAQFNIIKAGPIQPYLVLGAGISNFKVSADPTSGAESVTHSTSEVTVDGGGGVLVKVGPVKAFAEGRISSLMNNGKLVDFDSIETVPVSFGVVLFEK